MSATPLHSHSTRSDPPSSLPSTLPYHSARQCPCTPLHSPSLSPPPLQSHTHSTPSGSSHSPAAEYSLQSACPCLQLSPVCRPSSAQMESAHVRGGCRRGERRA